MTRMLGALFLTLGAVAFADAHALFLVPGTGEKVLVVFGDQLAPDDTTKEATWKRLEGLKLSARDESGKVTAVKFTKEKDHLLVAVPAGTRVVFGEVDAGLYAKGDAAAKLVKCYPKAVIGAVPADGGALGDKSELDIVPKVEAGKVRFQVLARGKPVSGVEVEVLVPGKKGDVHEATDEKGWTKAFDAAGRYGATCRKVEATAGERDGKKYDGISHTATLVVDVK